MPLRALKIFLIFVFAGRLVNADHGQWDCQANEVFIECGSCEASCKFPLIKNCSSDCRPPRCECRSLDGFVRAHDGACIHVSECDTYRIMSQVRPGQQVSILDRDSIKTASTEASINSKHKKTQKQSAHFDFPQTSPPNAKDYSEEVEIGGENQTSTASLSLTSPTTIASPSDRSNEDHTGLPPAIAPHDHSNGKKPSRSNKKHFHPINITKNYHIIDRDSFLIGAKHFSKSHSLPTDSSPGKIAATHRSSALVGNDNSEEENHGLQPPQIYGARPILPGEVGDKYVPKARAVGAPARNPQPPGNFPHKYAYAPSSPVLMTDDSAFALYPPQKYRIYKRDVEMPIGPS